jgi:hypothetical protein
MTDRLEFEGIGYHYFDYDSDCILVNQWIKCPDELKGQALTMSKLLPHKFRSVDLRDHYDGGHPEKSFPRKCIFRIIVEIDNVPTNNG